MPLPDVIQILPPPPPVHAQIAVPGSKSITNRALVLAALAKGNTTLQGALWSEDTQAMANCLRELGFIVDIKPDPKELANRVLTVAGLGGKIPLRGTIEKPLELYVGNAGTTARFLSALVCLGHGVYRLHGAPRMHQRPQAALFQALRELGYYVDSTNDKLPAVFHGAGPRKAACNVSIMESSQFASALLLSAAAGQWDVQVLGQNAEESPYVAMTAQLCSRFPQEGGIVQIEPDASSGSYFWAANYLLNIAASVSSSVNVAHWPDSGWQIDARFPNYLPLPSVISRQRDLADSIMTAIVIAPFAGAPIQFTDLGRLRVQECERVAALRNELEKCGAMLEEHGDTLTVYPSTLHGAEIQTYNDHRVAMCFSVLGLKLDGIRINNPSCVIKTFPNFFEKLAAKPPAGLGATILDASSGKPLSGDRLIAS